MVVFHLGSHIVRVFELLGNTGLNCSADPELPYFVANAAATRFTILIKLEINSD